MSNLNQLIKQRSDILVRMQEQVNMDVQSIQDKAEHMVECATCIQGQGYNTFILARNDFLNELEIFRSNYSTLVRPFS